MTYPKVLSEDETIDLALAGTSLARYGDGEMSIMIGGNCVSQIFDPRLREELRRVALEQDPRVLACIPNAAKSPRAAWANYTKGRYDGLFSAAGRYGSAFITRPDSAPWIDRPDFWAKVRALWADKDVVLVKGTERSLRESSIPEAASVRSVAGPRRDAFAVLDQIEEEIGTPSGPVLLCLGPAATVLAARLARKGVLALDLGHIGMFMRHAGLYAFDLDQLISPAYREEIGQLRARQKWGADGHKHADAVLEFAREIEATTVLDYGCGEQTLAAALKSEIRILGYDPGIPGRDGAPKPNDLVVCLDVLEHIEPDRLDAVLAHIFKVAGKAAFFVISTRPARTILPGGRNAHLIVESGDWWAGRILEKGWKLTRRVDREGREVRLWVTK